MTELNNPIKLTTQKSPSDIVISRIREMLEQGVLKSGDRLPSERKLALDIGISRSHIREALHKLEFYGIIKTLPQSGSVINSLGISALNGLITDVLTIQDYDFLSLVETRIVLEVNAIKMCAERRTDEDLKSLEAAHLNFLKYWDTDERVNYDFAFHRAIAEASHNPVFKALMLIITPDIMNTYNKERFCAPNTRIVEEHVSMLEAIRERNPVKAAELMERHMDGVLQFARDRVGS